jgi:hypothetical protein
MALNVTAVTVRIKHVFEACLFRYQPRRDLVGPPWYKSIKRSDIEHMIDYIRTEERKMTAEGTQMTMLDTRQGPGLTRAYTHDQIGYRRGRAVPVSVRPSRGALAYHGTGVRLSRAPHRPRRVSVSMTIALAGITALITVWLLAVAQARGTSSNAAVPEQLAVVQVQPGENLQRLAARVAPDAPVGSIVEKIRQLNELDSPALDVGQTLIAPVG